MVFPSLLTASRLLIPPVAWLPTPEMFSLRAPNCLSMQIRALSIFMTNGHWGRTPLSNFDREAPPVNLG